MTLQGLTFEFEDAPRSVLFQGDKLNLVRHERDIFRRLVLGDFIPLPKDKGQRNVLQVGIAHIRYELAWHSIPALVVTEWGRGYRLIPLET